MNEDPIAGLYSLKDIKVSPENLLLDPNNLRTILTEKDIKQYPDSEVASQSVQNRLYHTLLSNPAFKVNELAEAIDANGWINEGGFFVEAIPGSNKYLVLEGNRRTCAIKSLLNDKKSLKRAVLESLSNIEVKLLKVFNKTHEQRVKRVIVSARNTGGVLKFGPMHTALVAYLTHMDYLKEDNNGRRVEFYYDQKIAKHVANCYSLSGKRIKREMGIYRVFEQLQDAGCDDVREDIYTLIDLSIASNSLNYDYFCFDNETELQMTAEGLAKFIKLCIDPGPDGSKPIIHNPKQFPKFKKIHDLGSPPQLKRVEEGARDLEETYRAILEEQKTFGLAPKLQDISYRLHGLELNKLTGSEVEIDHIVDICGNAALLDAMADNVENSLDFLLEICKNLKSSNRSDVKSFANTLHRDITQFKKKL